jgi:type I restriction enzyme S subunit
MKDWTTKPLGDLCEVFADGDWVESKDQSNTGVRLIQTGNVGEGVFKDRGDKARYISEETFRRLRCTEIIEGDCLISRLPEPAGRSCLIPDTGEKMITAVDCTIVRFKRDQIIPEFFNYYSQSSDYLKGVDSETTGTTRKRISRSKLGMVNIPVPPLPEQERIVGILDEAFDGIAKAKALAEANLQNARALFQSHLQSVFSQKGEGWVEKRLGDVCEATQGVQIPKSEQSPIMLTGYRRYLYISDFESEKNLKYVRDEHPKKLVTPSDIIVANTGSAGKIFRGIDGVLSNNLFKVSFDPAKVDGDFIFFFVTSDLFREYQQGIMRGTANPHMGHVNFKSTPLPIPSIQTQKSAVEIIHKINEETQRLESLYQRKLNALDELKKSLLHQAFSGNL